MAVVVLLGSILAVAASLPVASASLAAAAAALVACDSDGLALRHSVDSAGRVTAVQVTGIDLACSGATVRLTLLDGGTILESVSAVLPTSGFAGSVTLPTPTLPRAGTISRVDVAVDAQ